MSLAELVVYWIPKCELWALAVISLLIKAAMMILVPRYTIPFWVVRLCKASIHVHGLVSSTSLRKLSSWLTWKIRYSGESGLAWRKGRAARERVPLMNIWGPGLYDTFSGYLCSRSLILWRRLGLVRIGFEKIFIRGLWSDNTWTVSLPRM